MLTVDLTTADHVPALAAVLADAMDVDAGWRVLFPGPERPAGLRQLFAGNLSLHVAHGCAWTGSVEGWPVATVTVRPPGGLSLGALAMLRHGLGPFVWTWGLGALRRLLWLRATYEALERDLGPEPHGYVHMMGVGPALQGRGLGGELLRHALADFDDRHPEAPLVLTTHLPQNVPFYERAGFRRCWERAVEPPNGPPYPVFGMRREAVTTGRRCSP